MCTRLKTHQMSLNSGWNCDNSLGIETFIFME